jgi:hypothetical protein
MAEETNFEAETKIDEALASARSVAVAGMSVTNRDVGEIIEADRHLARKKAHPFGIRTGVLRGPGQY